ncbi:MAG: flavin reductase family protein [Dehalococcoidia bacterium]|nr:flavin reductase family protein [Dehalococcoidia bacterium]
MTTRESAPLSKTALGPQTLLYPMPVLIIGVTVDGKPNFMTAAWGGIANSDPPMVSVGIRHQRHTMVGVRRNMALSVNIPSAAQVREADFCGIVTGTKEDKAQVCRFNVFHGKLADAPLISQCPVNLECKVVHILDLGSHALVVAQILETHVSNDCLTDGKPDVTKINPIAFCSSTRDYRTLGQSVGKAFSIGKELKTLQTS